MYYTYLLVSENYPDQIYIGYTGDVAQRAKSHKNKRLIHLITKLRSRYPEVKFIEIKNDSDLRNFK